MNKNITVWELINPSDKITFSGNDFKLVVIAVCLVGNCVYAAEEVGGNRIVPIFLFGSVDKWFIREYGSNFEDTYKSSDKKQLADILDSFTLGGYDDFIAYNKEAENIPPLELKKFKEDWNDKRTSMNNICARAWEIASNIRNKYIQTSST